MSLIVVAVYDTEENGRMEYTMRTLKCLAFTVDWNIHRLIIVDNNSFLRTKEAIRNYKFSEWTVITNTENIGTARAVNKGIKLRNPGEHVIKIDNDVVINQSGWVEEMEAVIERESSIGIVGLKRKDLAEWPLETGWAHSELLALPHKAGQPWVVVEQVNHVMGTCQMISSMLLDKTGGFFQTGIYGLDDSDMSYRSSLLGFKNVFIPHINIDHIDAGGDAYSLKKHRLAAEEMGKYGEICEEYRNGVRSLFVDIGE